MYQDPELKAVSYHREGDRSIKKLNPPMTSNLDWGAKGKKHLYDQCTLDMRDILQA